MATFNPWIESLVVAAILTLLYRVPSNSPTPPNAQRLQVFAVTFVVTYAVFYLMSSWPTMQSGGATVAAPLHQFVQGDPGF